MHAAYDVLEARIDTDAVEPRVHSQPGQPVRLILMPFPDISRLGLSRGAHVHDATDKAGASKAGLDKCR